jgi:hypothetical protein
MPQVNIHCVGNHFATFRCALGFLKFLTFGGQMHDTCSLRRVAHFFRCVAHYFEMRDTHLVRHVALLPNGRRVLIRRLTLFSYGKHVGT